MKTVVITGARRGIGLATAQRFLTEGYFVIGTATAGSLPMESPMLVPVQLDLSKPSSIRQAVAEIYSLNKKIDVLVNNAGIILDQNDTDIAIKKIRDTFEVDLFGIIDFTQQLMPLMHDGSHIISVDSSYGSLTMAIDDASSAGYRMAKAALNMYTKILAFHTAKKGIIVSSLDPGWVQTDMGNAGATETAKPDRKPEEAAADIYKLATKKVESGFFWRYGKKREW